MGANKDAAFKKYEDVIKSGMDKDSLSKFYAEWAETYDKDHFPESRSRFVPLITEELFNKEKSIKILDVGAGTGLAGEALKSAGYTNIDALDASREMLQVAKSKNIYKSIFCEYLGPKKLDIGEGSYDFLVCMGSLTGTHIKQDGFKEMIRITKPGGFIVFIIGLQTIGEAKEGIEAGMKKLEDEGRWEWKVNRIVEGYHHSDTPGAITQGVQYVFRIPDQ